MTRTALPLTGISDGAGIFSVEEPRASFGIWNFMSYADRGTGIALESGESGDLYRGQCRVGASF